MFIALRPGKRHVAPFTSGVVRAGYQPAIDHNSAATTGSENDAKNRSHSRTCAIMGFGKGEAVGVIGDPHRHADAPFKIDVKRTAIEPNRVSVLGQSCGR